MKKFLVLYRAPLESFEQIMKAPPEQQKAGMDAWNSWMKKVSAAMVDQGAALGKTLKVTADGASPTRNDLGGYSVMQAESKEALAELMKGHPHFTMKGGWIEIVDLVPM